MSRKDNFNSLTKTYSSVNNDIVIMYGSRYAGIHSVIFDFLKNKEYYYYDALPLDYDIQMDIMANDILNTFKIMSFYNRSFQEAVVSFSNISEGKKILVINNFTNILKDNSTFINMLISIIRELCKSGSLLVVLLTEDVNFIESDFYTSYSQIAHEISSLIKVEPYSVSEVSSLYKFSDLKDFVSWYSILGGNSNLWKYYSADISVKNFICDEIISPQGHLHFYGLHILPEDLRERTIYNTIMYLLSEGNVKLNDLHEKTGYDRAKISVYIKNLVKRGLIKKADSIDIGYDKCVKKGTYFICDNFARFWYKYIFINLTKTQVITPEKFYRKIVEQDFSQFREASYADICLDYLSKSYRDNIFGAFYDKDGVIDFAGTDSDGKLYLCACRFGAPHMAYSRLEAIISFIEREKIKTERIFLISANDFDQKLHLYSRVHENVVLLDYRD